MPAGRISEANLGVYFSSRQQGRSIRDAAREAGMSVGAAHNYEKLLDPHSIIDEKLQNALRIVNKDSEYSFTPKPYENLSSKARKAYHDISYFALRYYGLQLAPWQEDATGETLEKLQNDMERSYICMNVAPGTGKTVFFTIVLPSWLICRDRSIRGMTGHAVQNMANKSVKLLRDQFTNTTPIKASEEDIAKGIAQDAEATLVEDFGQFKPIGRTELWRADQFTVQQLFAAQQRDKDATWAAYGLDATFIGTRVNVAVWDDVETLKNQSAIPKEQARMRWDQIAEKRLEPGGVLILQGQRLSADDIYSYNLAKKRLPEDWDGDEQEYSELEPKYHHIVYKAHYNELCKGKQTHRSSAPPYPNGCLLMPSRLPYRELEEERRSNPRLYAFVYQQEDTSPDSVLVPPMWIEGGKDKESNEDYPGCLDREREIGDIPKLSPPVLSVATVDPSPSKNWAIQHWLYHPATQQRFLIDLWAAPLTAHQLLDYHQGEQHYTGIMEEWQLKSDAKKVSIRYWIVEANAAQRFLLQYNHVHGWRRQNSVAIISHETGRNKSDSDYGVWAIAPHYRYGRIRLPYGPRSRSLVNKYITELTRYPDYSLDDQVMAHWFLEWNIPRLRLPDYRPKTQSRPEWASRFSTNPLTRRRGA